MYFLYFSFKAGSLAMYFLNPNNYSVTLELPQFDKQPLLLFLLSAGDSDGLLSKLVSLSGGQILVLGQQRINKVQKKEAIT